MALDPLVTVLLVNYNYGNYLEECLESIRNQTYGSLQVVIVDDCSTDDSGNVVRRWMDRHAYNAQLIVHDSNRGLCAAANTGLAAAKGKYLALISADDKWDHEKLERQIDRFETLPAEYGVMYGATIKIDEHGRLMPTIPLAHAPEGSVYPTLIRRNFVVASSAVIRRECFNVVGGYDETLFVEDYDMWLRLASKYKFAFSLDAITYRRRHPMSFGDRQRNSVRWIETDVLRDVKQLGVDVGCDSLLKRRILWKMRCLYGVESSRYGMCFRVAVRRYQHPMLIFLYLLKTLKVPFIFVRVLWRLWFAVGIFEFNDVNV